MHNDPFALQDHRKRYRIRTRGRSLSNLMRMLSKTNHNLISCLSHFFCHGWILVKPTFCFFLKQIKNKIDNLSFQRSISGDEEGQPAGQVQDAEIVYVKERLAWRSPSSSISVRAGFSLVWIRIFEFVSLSTDLQISSLKYEEKIRYLQVKQDLGELK